MVTFNHGEFCTNPNCRLTHPPLCPKCGVWNVALCSCSALNTEQSRTKDCLIGEKNRLQGQIRTLQRELEKQRDRIVYLERYSSVPESAPAPYDPEFGDDRICDCGHAYYRHFDTYENMAPVGCKYCHCCEFREGGVPESCSQCAWSHEEDDGNLPLCGHETACMAHGKETEDFCGKPIETEIFLHGRPEWCPIEKIVNERETDE